MTLAEASRGTCGHQVCAAAPVPPTAGAPLRLYTYIHIELYIYNLSTRPPGDGWHPSGSANATSRH
eukprot:1556610-Karenia_brevis.AAC.1